MNLSFFFLWLNQSWTWNWIQAAARRFRDVAGTKEWRVMSSRLTVRGFGSRRRGFLTTRSSWTFRPNRAPAAPMRGSEKSLFRPSGWRYAADSRAGAIGGVGLTLGTISRSSVSWRFSRLRTVRNAYRF